MCNIQVGVSNSESLRKGLKGGGGPKSLGSNEAWKHKIEGMGPKGEILRSECQQGQGPQRSHWLRSRARTQRQGSKAKEGHSWGLAGLGQLMSLNWLGSGARGQRRAKDWASWLETKGAKDRIAQEGQGLGPGA